MIDMAKVLAPLGSTEARGKIGGLVYNTWRGICYVKPKKTPTNKRSSLQLLARTRASLLSIAWQGLTADERLSWDTYAFNHKLTDGMGVSKRLTGHNWFLRCNLEMLRTGKPIENSAPITTAPDGLTDFVAADGVLESILTWTPTEGTDKWIDIWIFGPHSKGASPTIIRARFKTFCLGEAGTTTINGLTVGRYSFFARVIDSTNGLTSPWSSDTADITAA